MNTDILMPILTISGIAVAAGYLLKALEKRNEHKFDERQLIERGRGANLAMWVGFFYLLGLYCGMAFDLIRSEYAGVFAVYGLVVMMMVSDGYCIFHDAYLNREEGLGLRLLEAFFFGAIWLTIAWNHRRWNPVYAWNQGAFALFYLFRGVMLLLRALVLRIQDRSSAKEEDDG